MALYADTKHPTRILLMAVDVSLSWLGGGQIDAHALFTPSAQRAWPHVLTPGRLYRIRLVAEPGFGREVFDALPRLVREKGADIFESLPAIWCKQVQLTLLHSRH